jgi:hypothetical protein
MMALGREHPNGRSPAQVRLLLRVDKLHGHTMAGRADAANSGVGNRERGRVPGACGVVYLSPAANSAGSGWSRPRDVNRTVMTSSIACSRPEAGRLPCL